MLVKLKYEGLQKCSITRLEQYNCMRFTTELTRKTSTTQQSVSPQKGSSRVSKNSVNNKKNFMKLKH